MKKAKIETARSSVDTDHEQGDKGSYAKVDKRPLNEPVTNLLE